MQPMVQKTEPASEEINRADMQLVVLHDHEQARQTYEKSLREFGFTRIRSYPTQLRSFKEHFNYNKLPHADLVVYGLQPVDETSWNTLGALVESYSGPVLAAANECNSATQERAGKLGVLDYIALDKNCGEHLALKAETALAAHRVNTMIEDDDMRARQLFVNVLMVMVKILESKDPYTRFHSHSVAKWSRIIGRRQGLMEEELDRLGLAAVFHDFGKIGVPDQILAKPDRLSNEEFELMKKHPTIARDLLGLLKLPTDLLHAIAHHHERWDGRGYPDKLVADQTPLWARIICLADAYDTMASRRAYKEPYTLPRIREELAKGAGTQFDPQLVEHLLSVLKEDGVAGVLR